MFQYTIKIGVFIVCITTIGGMKENFHDLPIIKACFAQDQNGARRIQTLIKEIVPRLELYQTGFGLMKEYEIDSLTKELKLLQSYVTLYANSQDLLEEHLKTWSSSCDPVTVAKI